MNTLKKIASIPYKLIVWAWAWAREFMFIGAAFFGAVIFDAAPVAAGMLFAFLWQIINISLGVFGESAKNPLLRDFMIRHKASMLLPSGTASAKRKNSDAGSNPQYWVDDGGFYTDIRNGRPGA